MPIEFRCNQCQNLLRTPDQAAGKKARCPQCGNVQDVPPQHDAPTIAVATVSHQDAAPASPAMNPAARGPDAPQNPFADAPLINPYVAPAHPLGQPVLTPELARSKLLGPAVGLIVTSGIAIFLNGLVMAAGLVELAEGADADAMGALIVFGAMVGMSGVVLVGAIRMLQLKNYGVAMTAVVLALVPCSGWCLSIPFGVWGLVILADASVKSMFGGR